MQNKSETDEDNTLKHIRVVHAHKLTQDIYNIDSYINRGDQVTATWPCMRFRTMIMG